MERKARLVALLCVVVTIVLWNAVFGRIVIVEGRRYIAAAVIADNAGAPPVRINDWMQPAVRRAFWTATGVGVAGALASVGVMALARRGVIR